MSLECCTVQTKVYRLCGQWMIVKKTEASPVLSLDFF